MSLADAQAETQAILANLQKGHDSLLKEATNRAVKPMNFAWDGDGLKSLKMLSETGTAFPVHELGNKVESFKPKVGENPIGTTSGFENAAVWKTESGANYVPSPSKEDAGVVAGFKNFEGVELPAQFAWKRKDEVDEENAPVEESKGEDIDAPAEEAQPEPEEAAPEPTPAPQVAGAVTKSEDNRPTNFAWVPTTNKPETEYDAQFIDQHASAPEQPENKLLAPSLEGLMDAGEPLGQTTYDSDFKGLNTANEGTKPVKKTAGSSLEGLMGTGEPLGQTTYDADYVNTHTGEGATMMKKEVAPSLEGILDGFAGEANTEYAAKYNIQDMIEKVVHAHKAATASLEGVFNFGEKAPMTTEYDASFVAKAVADATIPANTEPETNAGDLDTAAAQQDEGSSSASMEPMSEAPASEAQAKGEPVTVMDGGDSAADSISPPASEPASEPAAEPAVEPEANNVYSETESCTPVVEAPAQTPAFNAFQSVSHTTYTWPATSGKKPEELKPAVSDMIGGAMGTAPKENSVLEGDLDSQIAMQKKKMSSEYCSKYAWPVNTVNKRSYATGLPDSLWVMGTKGSVMKNVVEKSPKIPKASTKNAEVDHLSGSACVPDALDALDAAFVAKGTAAKTTKAPETPRTTRIRPTRNMPVAGFVPGSSKDVLVSKDQPVEGQIPSLRESLAPNPVSTLNALPLPRPPLAGGQRVGRILGNPMTLDPLRANPRYPQLSEKQANRWTTTASSSYGAPVRLLNRYR